MALRTTTCAGPSPRYRLAKTCPHDLQTGISTNRVAACPPCSAITAALFLGAQLSGPSALNRWYALADQTRRGGCGALSCWIGLSSCQEMVTGNEVYVSIDTDEGEAAALRKAEAHCGQFGKLARFNSSSAGRHTYHCVRRDQ